MLSEELVIYIIISGLNQSIVEGCHFLNAFYIFFVFQIKSNILVKHNGTVGRLKLCKIKVEGVWESGKGRDQGEPY